MKVVIARDGQSREITGWRKWAIAIPVIVISALLAAAAILFVFGLTFTIGAVLLVTIPIIVIVALLWQLPANQR